MSVGAKFKLATKTPETKRESSVSQTKKTNFSHSKISPLDQILFLQRAVGNQAVERLLKSGVIQTKLTIGQPGDIYEQEANRVADQVMRMPDLSMTERKEVSEYNKVPSIQRVCSKCEEELHRQPMEEEGEILQTKEVSGETPEISQDLESQINSVRGGGQPLPESVRAFFEPRFGQDFSQVRIHTGAEATAAARSVNALAYTMRNDVIFGEGQYRPGTADGRRLFAHELAHTIQQTGGGAPEIQRKHDLTAPKFAGDLVLEAVYDNKRVLKAGDQGAAVRKIQQALLDAGFSLPHGANGKFDSETKAAVEDFQRASGLGVGGGLSGSIAMGIDGIVGATTMGWLDQRFSAGPTPPGKTLGATPGCTTIKTVNVDLVSMDGSTLNGPEDLARASSIFNQCCVRFALAGGGSEGAESTRALLGGDNVLDVNSKCGNPPTAEETAMFDGATADFNLSGRIRAFYVGSITPSSTLFGHTDAYSVVPSCTTGSGAAVGKMVVITNTGSGRALAHEFGHILLNEGSSVHQNMDPDYLMSPAGSPPGERLTPDQCKTIFDNA